MRSLRRPMFRRGGKVSSRNNGIVSGFASGGRVGYRPGGPVRPGEELSAEDQAQSLHNGR